MRVCVATAPRGSRRGGAEYQEGCSGRSPIVRAGRRLCPAASPPCAYASCTLAPPRGDERESRRSGDAEARKTSGSWCPCSTRRPRVRARRPRTCCAGSPIARAPTLRASRRCMFHELNTSREGGSIEKVQRWFAGRVLEPARARLPAPVPPRRDADRRHPRVGARGPRLSRRDAADQLPAGSTRRRLAGRDVNDDAVAHAVGLTIDRLEAKADEELVMIDPWPGVTGGASDRGTVPADARARAPRPELPRARVLLGRLVVASRGGTGWS